MLKNLAALKSFFILNLPHSTQRKKDISLIFFYRLVMACFEVAFLQTAGAHFDYFLANVIAV